MINIKNKKMQEKVIGTVILLVFVFIAILIGLSRLNLQSNTLQTACSLSIEERDAAYLGRLEFKEYLPLNCVTERVCLSDKLLGGCSNLKATKANPVRYVQVKTKEDVARAFAEAMYRDYVMTGSGEKNFMERKFFGTTYCLFTSKLTLDNSTANKIKDINDLSAYDIYNQMAQLKLDNGDSYLRNVMKLDPSILNDPLNSIKLKNTKFPIGAADYNIAFTFSRKGTIEAWAKGLGIFGAGVVSLFIWPEIIAYAGIQLTATAIFGAAGTSAYLALPSNSDTTNKKSFEYTGPLLVLNNPEALKKLNCDNVATLG